MGDKVLGLWLGGMVVDGSRLLFGCNVGLAVGRVVICCVVPVPSVPALVVVTIPSVLPPATVPPPPPLPPIVLLPLLPPLLPLPEAVVDANVGRVVGDLQ